jgi:glycosyltransferase involved in cell wall biosynthesis
MDAMTALVSLVVCTIGRRDALARLLASLERQTNDAFELILVDQSNGSEVEALLTDRAVGRGVRHLRSERGLSRGRNVGLRHVRGQVIGFPDDDCWYDPDVVDRVHGFFQHPDIDVVTGRTVDGKGVTSLSPHRTDSGVIDRHNVFVSGNSNTLFARTSVARDVNGFDESFGVGATTPFQSCEETDFLLRCLRKGHRLYFSHDFIVHHDQIDESSATRFTRARVYSQGYGRLLRLHGYGAGYLAMRIGRALARGTICLAVGDQPGARQRFVWASGSFQGFLASARP